VVFARPVDFDYEAFKAQHQQQLRSRSGQGHLIASEEQILSVKHPRMFGLNDPKVEGFLKILDAAATISRAGLNGPGKAAGRPLAVPAWMF
jgi:hypothetical protein